ncbi:TRAP transporter substrate-binding protein DctP [Parasedimentitalea maritima]|uniref:C4-dicarboxylate ABC transporter substrate-binding protein n=1 Tax=Parasedimentitalea maritima TaxID=2578117 RepID=A0A6A4RKA0_9RHOB|nr:TRAP transporter substrate-binding protein DctP [Zongyanglinia marina]KAE9631015.1 C4-dicarboxylate ABC transporter substrate-binding protein [Zongyanglinia marina]
MKLISTLTAGAVALAIASPVTAAEVEWKMTAAIGEGSFLYQNFMERFAKNVGMITQDRVEIQPFGAGVLAPAFKAFEAVQDGIVEAGHSTPSYLVNQDPTNAIFASFPGGMSPEATMHWVYEGGGEKMLQDFRRADMGLHSLVVGIGTSEIMAHSNVKIQTIEDLEGVKYRTSGAFAAVLQEEFGGVPTVVPGNEIYTLLQRKGVDAIEWSTPGANISEGFHEVAPYMIMPGVHQPSFLWEVFVKQETWDALPGDLQNLITAAAKLSTYESFTRFGDSDIKAMAQFRDTKVEVVLMEREASETIREAGRNWARAKAATLAEGGNTRMQEVLDSYLAYQADWAANSSYLVRDSAE